MAYIKIVKLFKGSTLHRYFDINNQEFVYNPKTQQFWSDAVLVLRQGRRQ